MTLAGILERISGLLERAGIAYMITGSIASSFHGAPRATRDLDIIIDPAADALEWLVGALQGAGLYVDADAARSALAGRGQFNAIESTSGWKIDFVIRKDRPFSKAEFGRRLPTDLLGAHTWVATLEDMVLAKLEWAADTDSERQLRDVVAMVDAAEGSIDLAYLEKWLVELGLLDDWSRALDLRDRA